MSTSCCSWDKKINDVQQRFKVLSAFNDKAVLDKETGLVWEREPIIETFAWPNARLLCAQKAVGERGGWRLPAFSEMASLVDPAIMDPAMPRVPAGHPFLNVQPGMYWTATLFAEEPGSALAVNFGFVVGSDAPIDVTDANTAGGQYYVWAVRGGCPALNSY